MKQEVIDALERAARARRSLLSGLTPDDRIRLLEDLFVDFFFHQWRTLLKWAALTGQSSQIDTGYIAQHTASLVLGEPGQGFRGKGDDLKDKTEVKSAAILSGVDRPRWNHNLGTIATDAAKRKKGLPTIWEEYLASPSIFYLLFDRVIDDVPENEKVLRVRAWCIDAQADVAWRSLVETYVASRSGDKYNLQLHPPVGYDDSIVVNTLGNLDMANVKALEARIYGLATAGTEDSGLRVEWILTPAPNIRPILGRCVSLRYGGRNARPSRLNTVADMLPDLDIIRELLPDVDLAPALAALRVELSVPVDELSEDETED